MKIRISLKESEISIGLASYLIANTLSTELIESRY